MCEEGQFPVPVAIVMWLFLIGLAIGLFWVI
jgi:hypothetical protein